MKSTLDTYDEVSEVANLLEVKSRMWLQGDGERGSCSMGTKFQLRKMNTV